MKGLGAVKELLHFFTLIEMERSGNLANIDEIVKTAQKAAIFIDIPTGLW